MKKTVVFDEYNEIDIKPSELLQKYTQLIERDIRTFFSKGKRLKSCSCPACQSKGKNSSFRRFGMRYVECGNCSTLYISPRPDDTVVDEYYNSSTARTFWHGELSKYTSQKRLEKIIRPRFEWIMDSVQEYLPGAEHIADIHTEQYGYIEELKNDRFFKRKTLLNPSKFLKKDGLEGIDTVDVPLDKTRLKNEVDVVAIFEVADRTSGVDKLFKSIRQILKVDGLCFMTGILISGFDLQMLWDKAENIFPPDRLNVFSVEGLQILFERYDFECLEFSTPGILDVEIVENFIKHNPQAELPRFMKYLLKNSSAETKKLFQEFLQENLLSSYARILIRKK